MSSKKKPAKKKLEMKAFRIVGPGRFVQRSRKPLQQGKKVKSVLIRVDANFAKLCRKRAETEGSITEVTRKLFQLLNGGGK